MDDINDDNNNSTADRRQGGKETAAAAAASKWDPIQVNIGQDDRLTAPIVILLRDIRHKA